MKTCAALLALATLCCSCLAVEPGAYLCDRRSQCPFGLTCRGNVCDDSSTRGTGTVDVSDPNAWVAEALQQLEGRPVHWRTVNYGITDYRVQALTTGGDAEACTITATDSALPAGDGDTIKLVVNPHVQVNGTYSDFSAGIDPYGCFSSPGRYEVGAGEACAWLIRTRGGAQTIVKATSGSLAWTDARSDVTVNLGFDGGSLNVTVDYAPCQ